MTEKSRNENDKFISEPIQPNKDSFDTSRMASGEPGMPGEFKWEKNKYNVAEVIETWKSTGKCHSGSDEKYVRRHWFRIRTQTGEVMTIYCSRQPGKRGKKPGTSWVLYSIEEK
jgi:hypothetical protein